MEAYKREFIEFLQGAGVLKFGDFTAKSGRKIPYFVNAGMIKTGDQITKMGEFYAKAYADKLGNKKSVLYGPAYKGISLSISAAVALSKTGLDLPFFFNRKEVKDHGDVGILLGYKLQDGDRVIMIEDVTTSGKSMEETVPKVRGAADVTIVGLMVSLNRMEVGLGGVKSALDEIKETYGFDARAIVSMADVVEHLHNRECQGRVVIDDKIKAAIDEYYEQYGCK